jgi:ORF6N domain
LRSAEPSTLLGTWAKPDQINQVRKILAQYKLLEPMKPSVPVESLILSIREQKVILDADLAELYGVDTKRLNEQVKRNSDRFPTDFVFQLSAKELAHLKSQFATSNPQPSPNQYDGALRSQFATSKHGGRRTRPYAFTEHGALMAANVLNSPEAVAMSVYVIRAFIKQRELLRTHTEILKKIAQIDAKLLKHDDVLRAIVHELQPLLNPPPTPPKRQIGFGEP